MERKFTLDDFKKACKKKDAWWTVILVDPLACRLALPIANYTNLTPNAITAVSFLIGLISVIGLYTQNYYLAAATFYISFVLDCIDGKIARLKGTGTIFGTYLDFTLDRIQILLCAFALALGIYNSTGDITIFGYAFLIMLLEYMRYLNALQIYKVNRIIASSIKKAEKKANLCQMEKLNKLKPSLPEEAEEEITAEPMNTIEKVKIRPNKEFKEKFTFYMKVRNLLTRNRIRPHLFSGIEFQMFIFIIGPVLGMIKETIILSSIALVIFELAIVFKLWYRSREVQKQINNINERYVS